MSAKNATILIKAQKRPKSKKKKPNFEKVVGEQLPISLTTNWQLTAKQLAVAVSKIY
jgi:hypothetical protein